MVEIRKNKINLLDSYFSSNTFLKILLVSIFAVLIIIQPVHASPEDLSIVINSRDWRDIYLGVIYSGFMDGDPKYFNNLEEARLKSQMIPKNSKVIVLESANPVMKNYGSMYLKVNGYNDFEVITYSDYADLQEKLWETIDTKGYVVLSPEFGTEAIAISSYLIKNRFAPLFLNADNLRSVREMTRDSPIIIAGHFPVRHLLGMKSADSFIDNPDTNIEGITRLALRHYESDWAVITRVDRILPNLLASGKLVFVYHGDIDQLANLIRDSSISNFEVIGADSVGLVQNVERMVGRDLKFLLMYGRTITNVEGLKGTLLDLDTFFFDYPSPNVIVTNTQYYPKLDVVAVTFSNSGNIAALLFSTLETGGESFSDSNLHVVHPGTSVTIPFKTDGAIPDNLRATISAQYWYSMPLKKVIESEEGNPFIRATLTENQHYEDSIVQLTDYEYDDISGMLSLYVKNPNSEAINAFVEVVLSDESVLSSSTIKIRPGSTKKAEIPTPYLRWPDIESKTLEVNIYYGLDETILTQSFDIIVKKVYLNTITGNLTRFIHANGSLVGVIVLVLVIAVLAFLYFRKKKKHHHHH